MKKLINIILELYKTIFKIFVFLIITIGIYGFCFLFPIFLAVKFSIWYLLLWCASPIWLGLCNSVSDWVYDRYGWTLENLFD